MYKDSRCLQLQCTGDQIRLSLFFKLMLISLCTTLLVFALTPDATLIGALKMMALGIVLSIVITFVYPEVRGVKTGDPVSVVNGGGINGLLGRFGRATAPARKNEQIKILLDNGGEVVGIVESYIGLVGPAKIRLLYEEKLVE